MLNRKWKDRSFIKYIFPIILPFFSIILFDIAEQGNPSHSPVFRIGVTLKVDRADVIDFRPAWLPGDDIIGIIIQNQREKEANWIWSTPLLVEAHQQKLTTCRSGSRTTCYPDQRSCWSRRCRSLISDKNGTSKLNKLAIFDHKWNFWNLVANFDK